MSEAVPASRRRLRKAVLALGGVIALAVLPACSSTPSASVSATTSTSHPTTTSTSAAPPVTFEQGSSAQVAACESDAKVLEVALEAYMAEKGAFPTPPSSWSASTYAANFAPLTSATDGGPYLHNPLSTTSFVIEYDSSGHVWVAPPGTYGAVYNPAQSLDNNPNYCLAAVR